MPRMYPAIPFLIAAISVGLPASTLAKPNTYPGEHSAFTSDPVETAKRQAERPKRKEERKKRRKEKRNKRLNKSDQPLDLR